MVDEMNTQGTPPPVPNTNQQAASQATQHPNYAAPSQQYAPPAHTMPHQAHAPMHPPMLTELSGGMKFGWLVVGVFMGIGGILLAWLTNASSVHQVRSDAVKFAVIGLVICIVGWLLISLLFGALFASAMSAVGSYYY